MFDLIPDTDRLFIIRRACELADQMDRYNTPGTYPTALELQEWVGAATAILKMVAESA